MATVKMTAPNNHVVEVDYSRGEGGDADVYIDGKLTNWDEFETLIPGYTMNDAVWSAVEGKEALEHEPPLSYPPVVR